MIGQRIGQLQQTIAGAAAQKKALEEQLASVIAERMSLADLVARGLVDRTRVLELQRSESGLRGQIGQADADLARFERAIGENTDQIDQLTKDRASEVSNALRDTQSKLLDVLPRLKSARQALDRTIIRAPYSGTVVGLTVFSIGSVIGPGQRVLDIVPSDLPLVVEAQVPVADIADIAPGVIAEVHFAAYKQRVAADHPRQGHHDFRRSADRREVRVRVLRGLHRGRPAGARRGPRGEALPGHARDGDDPDRGADGAGLPRRPARRILRPRLPPALARPPPRRWLRPSRNTILSPDDNRAQGPPPVVMRAPDFSGQRPRGRGMGPPPRDNGENAGFRQRLDNLGHLWRLTKQVWRTSRWLTVASIVLRLIRAIQPVVALYIAKLIIDEVVSQIGQPAGGAGLSDCSRAGG